MENSSWCEPFTPSPAVYVAETPTVSRIAKSIHWVFNHKRKCYSRWEASKSCGKVSTNGRFFFRCTSQRRFDCESFSIGWSGRGTKFYWKIQVVFDWRFSRCTVEKRWDTDGSKYRTHDFSRPVRYAFNSYSTYEIGLENNDKYIWAPFNESLKI